MRRQKYYTIPEAMEAALWCHWCGDYKQADKLLRLVINNVTKGSDSGQGRQPSPTRG